MATSGPFQASLPPWFLVFFVVALLLPPSEAYISYTAVPRDRKLKWLKQMTNDFTHAKLGDLSQDQISTAPELLHAWSHTPQRSIEKALALESLVKRLVDEHYYAGNDMVSGLTVEHYNCLLHGWASSDAGDAAAERCESIVQQMELEGGALAPTLASYKACIMAWRQAGSNHSALRAQRILERLIYLYQNNPKECAHLMPDSDCFDIVLQCWSKIGHPRAPEQAERVLAAMERLYESTGNRKVKPRTFSFNAVLAAWARSPHDKAADRALDLLGFMELLVEKHGDSTVVPDNVSYRIVIGALKHCKDPVVAALKTECLLCRVEERHRQDCDSIVPDTILYNTAMGCWAKANLSGSYQRARSILDRQIRLYKFGYKECRPDVFGFTSVIASAAAENGNSEERNKAFNVALSVFRQMEQAGVKPNHVTYGNMMKACARLLPAATPARRHKWARRFFEESRLAGCVGDMVLSRLREAVPPDMYKEIVQGHSRKKVPTEWTANLPVIPNERKQRLSREMHKAEV